LIKRHHQSCNNVTLHDVSRDEDNVERSFFFSAKEVGDTHENVIYSLYPSLVSIGLCPPTFINKEAKMKSLRKELWFNAPQRVAFINITAEVSKAVKESGVKEGLCLVNAMHITASVFINDDESGLHQDYNDWLEELAPHEPVSHYRHNRTGEDNGDAHLKRQIMGREVVVAITDGDLDFGPWEQIFYGEFDGRRKKRVLVKIIGE
jgi:secondary thiamine-phosphate synthase enzyme